MTVLPRFLLAAWLLACLVWGCSSCSSTSEAPVGTWPTARPEAQGFDSGELASVIEKIDSEELPFDSVQIVRDGILVLDAYFYPYLGEQPHDIASVTKSITSTLVGIAVDRDLLALDDGMLEHFGPLAPQHASASSSSTKVNGTVPESCRAAG